MIKLVAQEYAQKGQKKRNREAAFLKKHSDEKIVFEGEQNREQESFVEKQKGEEEAFAHKQMIDEAALWNYGNERKKLPKGTKVKVEIDETVGMGEEVGDDTSADPSESSAAGEVRIEETRS